jgi:hypothetical protein
VQSPRTLLVLLTAALAVPSTASADDYFLEEGEEFEVQDADIQLLDTHIAMHTGANIGAGIFGSVSIALGIDQFAQRDLFSGLTFTLWGAATLISSATSTESALRQWQQVRPALLNASETERRLYRTQEADRLTRLAINRAIGLAADGASLGIGIVLLVAPAQQASVTQGLATSLVLNGSFLLGIDAFRTAVDDQVARKWRARNEASERGYFSVLAPRHRGIAAVSPWAQPTTSLVPASVPGQPSTAVLVPGGMLGFTAIY